MSRQDNELDRVGRYTTAPPRIASTSFVGHKVYNREFGKPISYDLVLARWIKEQVKIALGSPNPLHYDPPPTGVPTVDGEIKRFICALKAYEDSPNPAIPRVVLTDGITDKTFASKLKKIKANSYVKSQGGRFLIDTVWDDIPWYLIRDIGEIFNYKYWLFWDQEDPHDEIHFFRDIDIISEESLSDLKYHTSYLLDNLSGDSMTYTEEDVLLDVTSSKCILNGKSIPKWMSKKYPQSYRFSRSGLVGTKAYVQKCPEDNRCAIILSPDQSNSVRLIEKQVADIAERMKFSAYTFSDAEFKRRYDKFYKNNAWFLCRDIEKDGITKPRALIQTVCEAIQEKSRKAPACKYFSIFNSFTLKNEGVAASTPRGVGLGMSAALTTVLQCALVNLIQDRIDRSDTPMQHPVDALVFHDDIALGFQNEDDVIIWEECENEIFAEYQLLKKHSKTFYMPSSTVLCERYQPPVVGLKESYKRMVAYMPFAACNIAHAKALACQSLNYVDSSDIESLVHDYVTYWGTEFCLAEMSLPYSLGGWIPSKYKGIDTTFLYADDEDLSVRLFRACEYNKPLPPVTSSMKDKTSFISPVYTLYGDIDTGTADKDNRYFTKSTTADVARKMFKYTRPNVLMYGWHKCLNKRKWLFDHKQHTSLLKLYISLQETAPEVDYVPRPEWVDTTPFDVLKIFPDDEDKSPVLRNPLLSYLSWLNPGKFPNVIPAPISPIWMAVNKSEQPDSTSRWTSGLTEIHKPDRRIFRFNGLIADTHQAFTEVDTGWLNNNRMAEAWYCLTGERKMPINYSKSAFELASWRQTDTFKFCTNSNARGFNALTTRMGFTKASLVFSGELISLTSFREQIMESHANKWRRLNNKTVTKPRYMRLLEASDLPVPDTLAEYYAHVKALELHDENNSDEDSNVIDEVQSPMGSDAESYYSDIEFPTGIG